MGLIKRFQEANPDINIVYQYFPYEVLISKLQAGYNSGTVADMQQMFGTWVTDDAAFGLLDPVPANLAEGFTDRFWEATLPPRGQATSRKRGSSAAMARTSSSVRSSEASEATRISTT